MAHTTREQRQELFEQMLGETIADKFKITRLLGFGGMGAVYEALQSPMNRKVALKVIPTHDPTASARFEREALTISRLRHPNTVTVFDYGQTHHGQLFLSMEHLQGHTLTHLVRSQGPLHYQRVVHIAEQICRSLAEAHRAGIIHRDIKPDNIFLIQVDQDPDYVKVLDFGIAKAIHGEESDESLTAEGRIVGTPRYMAPEQVLGQTVDHRADLYSLGCLLIEMLTGAPPFTASGATQLMIAHAQEAPPRLADRLSPEQLQHIPRALEEVVMRTLSKDPNDRPSNTEELRRMMSEAANMPMTFTGTGPIIPAYNPHHTGPQTAPPTTLPASLTNEFENHTGNNFTPDTGSFSGQTVGASPSALADAPALIEPISEQPARPSKTPIFIAVLAALLIGSAGIGFFVLQNEDPAPNEPPAIAAKTTPEVAPPVKIEDAPPKTAEPVPLRIVSDPAGASILRSGKKIGVTPMTIERDSLTGPTLFRLELKGYAASAIELDPTRAQPPRAIALEATRKGRKGKKTRKDRPKTDPTPKVVEPKVEPKVEDPPKAVEPKKVEPKEPRKPFIPKLGSDVKTKPKVEKL